MVSSASEPTGSRIRRPVIGLTTYSEPAQMLFWDDRFAMLHQAYVDAVSAAGSTVVLLPPQSAEAADVVDCLDGLILSGGADLDPARYGQLPEEHTGVPRSERDEWEAALLDAAMGQELPTLGICRGMQLVNAALGGTLHQHTPTVVGHTGHQPRLGTFGTTTVKLLPDSQIGQLLGGWANVSCHHHQSLDRVADGLRVVGRSEDGTIEAVESERHDFLLAVQWHPEQHGQDVRLFEALTEAARQRQHSKVDFA